MRIEKLYTAVRDEWDEIHSISDYSTYLHSREWYENCAKHPGLLGVSKCAAAEDLVHFSDGSSYCAISWPFGNRDIVAPPWS